MDISGTTLKSLNQMYEQSVPIGSAIADVANQVPHNQHTVYLPLGYQFIICVILFRTPCYNPIQVHKAPFKKKKPKRAPPWVEFTN